MNSTPATATTVNQYGEMTSDQEHRLAELEPIIERGLANFVEVGHALAEISDARLYRKTHSTFKAYVEEKYKLSVSRAYRMIESAEMVEMLPNGQQSVTNERQARELLKVKPEKRAKVVELASANGKLTAEVIREAVLEVEAAPAPLSPPAPGVQASVGGVDAGPQKLFPIASSGSVQARKWWYHKATPAKRGSFINYIMAMSGPVEVESKERFRQRFDKWMAEHVSEAPKTPAAPA